MADWASREAEGNVWYNEMSFAGLFAFGEDLIIQWNGRTVVFQWATAMEAELITIALHVVGYLKTIICSLALISYDDNL